MAKKGDGKKERDPDLIKLVKEFARAEAVKGRSAAALSDLEEDEDSLDYNAREGDPLNYFDDSDFEQQNSILEDVDSEEEEKVESRGRSRRTRPNR